MDPIASDGEMLVDGRVRVDRVYKTPDMASHTYVLSFPGSPSRPDAPITREVRIGFTQSADMRKRDLLTLAKQALKDVERMSARAKGRNRSA